MPDVQEALSFMVVRRKKVYCIIPDISTTQIVPFESLKSLKPRPSSGFLAEVEEEEAPWQSGAEPPGRAEHKEAASPSSTLD